MLNTEALRNFTQFWTNQRNGGAFDQKIIELPLLIKAAGQQEHRVSLAGVESSNVSHFVGLCQEQQETELINETRSSFWRQKKLHADPGKAFLDVSL